MVTYLSLHTIRGQIPSDAVRVKSLLNSTIVLEVPHRRGGRQMYALFTAAVSFLNVGAYTCLLFTRTILAIPAAVRGRFHEKSPQLIHDGNAIIESMYCSVSLTLRTVGSFFPFIGPSLSEPMLSRFSQEATLEKYEKTLDDETLGTLDLEQYVQYLEDPQLKGKYSLPDYKADWLDKNCEPYRQDGQLNHDRIRAQVIKELGRAPFYLAGQRLNDLSNISLKDDKDKPCQEWFDQLFQFLQTKGFTEENIWRILAGCQQGQTAELWQTCKAIFHNDNFNLHISAGNMLADSSTHPGVMFGLDVKNGVVNIQSNYFFKIGKEEENGGIDILREIEVKVSLPHNTGRPKLALTLNPIPVKILPLLSAKGLTEPSSKLLASLEAVAPCLTLFDIETLSSQQQEMLYYNVEALEKKLNVQGKHLPENVLKVVRSHQEKKFVMTIKTEITNGLYEYFSERSKTVLSKKNVTIDDIYRLIFENSTNSGHCKALRELLIYYPALKHVRLAIDAKERLEGQVSGLTGVTKIYPFNVFDPFIIAGQPFMIHSPRYEIAPNKSNLGDAWRQFFQNITGRCHFVINLVEKDECLQETAAKREINYIHHLESADAREFAQPADPRKSYRTQVYKPPQENGPMVIHLDGFKDGHWDLLQEGQVVNLLQEIKHHFEFIQARARVQRQTVQDCCILVHCRQGLNRTSFYMALLNFMMHPEWVRGRTNEQIVDQLLKVLEIIAETPRNPDVMSIRLPLSDHIREFCRPQFIAALRQVIG